MMWDARPAHGAHENLVRRPPTRPEGARGSALDGGATVRLSVRRPQLRPEMMISKRIAVLAAAVVFLFALSVDGHFAASPMIALTSARASEVDQRAEKALANIFVNFQISEVVGAEANGYIDIQNLYKDGFTQADATAFFSALALKADEVLPFFTDKKVTSVKIEIIRITNMDEYNVGSGFVKVGAAQLVKQDDVWRVSALTLTDGTKK
jgi:hypothetical protein